MYDVSKLGDLTRRHEHASQLAASEDLERQQLADPFLGEQPMQIVDAAHRLAGELHDQIARLQFGFGRGRALDTAVIVTPRSCES